MRPKLTFLMLPYTRAELFEWGRLMAWAGVGWAAGMKEDWKSLPIAHVRGKRHGYTMRLDRSDWCQRLTYFLGRYYEFGVLRTLDVVLRPGDHFVDVGANIGMIALHARFLVGHTGKGDCFEPNPECVEALREHLRINSIENVTVHPCALGESPGSMSLKLTSEHSGTATLAAVEGDVIREVQVDVRVGDLAIKGVPRLIKIDVEGFELHVLKGLAKTISMHKPFLITELIDGHLRRAGTTTAAVSEYLFDQGYEAYAIHSERKRRYLPERLVLRRVLRGTSLAASPDILWAHPVHELSLHPFREREPHEPGADAG